MNAFEEFSQLHQNAEPLLLGNIWNVNSATLFERQGFKAIGTSSMAVAKTFGYEDGENLPFDTLFQLAKRVMNVVKIPLTVDIEGGYSRTVSGIVEHIKMLYDIGVAGINFEDTIPGATRQLRPVAEFQTMLSTVAENLSRNNIKIFLNVRTDGFLLGMSTALTETLMRIKSYENAGAHGIFVPCITAQEDIRKVVSATPLPINVMCMPELPGFDELKTLGVKRISIGPFLNTYLHKKTEETIGALVQERNFSSLFR